MIQDAKTSNATEMLTRTKNRIEEINEYVAGETKDDATSMIKWQLHKIMAEARSAVAKTEVDVKTVDAMVKITTEEAIGAALNNQLTKAKIALTKEEERAISVELTQEWEKLSLNHDANRIDAMRTKVMWTLGKMNIEQRQREMIADAITSIATMSNMNHQRGLDRNERRAPLS